MGAEANIRGRIIEILRPLHAVAIENALDKGTPDVNTLAGWIELKQINGWPVNRGPVRVPKFTAEQRFWLRKRCEAGGAAYLLIRVGKEWFLFWGHWAAENLGEVDRLALMAGAVAHWPAGLIGTELVRVLLQRGVTC